MDHVPQGADALAKEFDRIFILQESLQNATKLYALEGRSLKFEAECVSPEIGACRVTVLNDLLLICLPSSPREQLTHQVTAL